MYLMTFSAHRQRQALLTAELGTAFPEAGAGVAWVEEAFGPSAGWICGYLGWIAGGKVVARLSRLKMNLSRYILP